MGYALKLVHVQPFMSSGTIKSFNISVLCWISRLNVKQGFVVPTRPVHQHLAQIFRVMITTQCSSFASLLIQTKAIVLAKNTAEYLQTKLCEEIKLSELIVKMGTNRNKLNDAFKTTYGTTMFAWLHEQRMALARTLLETTTLSVLQVGDQVGYSDSNNFSTAFKREHKLSPKQYRQDYLRSSCAPSKGFGG